MGIQALPHTTVRVLGATQVLTDPASVVKELIDNALDAHATSIAVEIHSNTLDVIQVRDNGHGIAPEDRALVARRYCTSKISHDDDLKDIGGSSLGFRGEALASAAELSETLTITTRVEGEQIAASLSINQQGEVGSQERASLPVGTTVKITNFIKANPVRRQFVLKQTDATLKKIKHTLQAYAFARLHARFSLRILKAKNNKGDWVYAPKLNGSAEDAALKIVGSACAMQCDSSTLEHGGFALHSILPRAGCEAGKVSNIGAYVYVDARPVTTARGTFKQILKVFRESLRRGDPSFENAKDLFLYLNISCPTGSYDINIEPAKDNVIFENPDIVIKAVKLLFAQVYPQQDGDSRKAECEGPASPLPQPVDAPNVSGLGAATVVGPPRTDVTQHMLDIASSPNRASVPHGEHTDCAQHFRSTMYGCDEEDLDQLDQRPATSHTEADFEELRVMRNDVTVSNPWVLARLNGSVQHPKTNQASNRRHLATPATGPLSSPPKRHPGLEAATEAFLPTPRPSSPSLQLELDTPASSAFRPSRGFCGNPLQTPQLHPQRLSNDGDRDTPDLPRHAPPSPPAQDHGLLSEVSQTYAATPIDAIPTGNVRPRQKQHKQSQASQVNKPFQPPLRQQPQREKVWFDHLEDMNHPRKYRRGNQHSDGLVTQGEFGDSADEVRLLTPPRHNRDIREYVGPHAIGAAAAELAVQREEVSPIMEQPRLNAQEHVTVERPDAPHVRGFIPASEVATLSAYSTQRENDGNDRPKSRRTNARRALSEIDSNTQNRCEVAEADDTRPGTRKKAPSRVRSLHKPGRTKSAKLPLERVPAGQGMHHVATTLRTNTKDICRVLDMMNQEVTLLSYNEPALNLRSVFVTTPPVLHDLTNNLHDLLIKTGSDEERPSPELLFNELQAALKRYGDDATFHRDPDAAGHEVMSSL